MDCLYDYMSRKQVPFTATDVGVTAGVCWRMKIFISRINRMNDGSSDEPSDGHV